ncbi:hypothetical protein ABB37_10090 [Leptomonas pyrrhocoris]|uniref:GYF domain-containing protein n=1 Tax=Leptomonas pyrrhocoris TaxID=157538 RepID=A0A0N0DQL4_LEPPY|nr:hypothetical protein ABB37_10090 [Leptomonas pyrrhocoris]XP_015651580.1 hypothetical protein ABB37_10090 [Leptomonas pyrrhocoris]KPA73140.1 hypothetical protein ABB37_10090 [Leptomonas pyrrhocoris]KPA73141.1 hypothetical protein ABB37_10090 [Leptomonas pyrrhocoris]|eukprot:XP_015651579.1 hypothetical protein ABB37_10090 [Leptomonas pyrrhocoris]
MKRARSSSIDSDAASAGAASSSLGLGRAPSSSSTTSSSAVEEFEEPAAMPLLFLLTPVLSLVREEETFAESLRRLAKEKSADPLARLTELHSAAMAQYELVLMNMTREAILLKAVTEARRTGATLPPVWMLRWTAKPAVEHGPFTDDVVQKWGREGFFAKKEGELRDINAVNPAWLPALKAVEDL